MRTLWTLWGVVVLLCALPAAAQPTRHKVKVERLGWQLSPMLTTYVSVVDANGKPVSGRSKKDFGLVVDATEPAMRADDVAAFSSTDETVDVVVVVEVALSMRATLETVHRGLALLDEGMAAKRRPRLGLVTFADEVDRVANLGPPPAVAAARLTAKDTFGELHLLDAVHAAIDMLAATPRGHRKLIVVLSDGKDVSQERKAFTAVGKRAAEQDVVIDTIGFAVEPDAGKLLGELSNQSNGTSRTCASTAELAVQFQHVVAEIAEQYVARFLVPLQGDLRDHTFQVVVDVGGEAVNSNIQVNLIPKSCCGGATPRRPWWIWISVAGSALAVCALVLVWLLQRRKDVV